jgi:phosphoribosylamine--glycine ligase
MRLLDSDILDIFGACIDRTLDKLEIKWKNIFACTVVLASLGYPGNYKKGEIITGIEEAEKQSGIVIFQAGTKKINKDLVTNGGRVLGVSATGKSLKEALLSAYEAISKISFKGMQWRKDIGKTALEKSNYPN